MLATVALGACGDGDADTDALELTAEEVLAGSADAMHDTSGATFVLVRQGAEVYIDSAGLLAFSSATGRYAAPASADALVDVSAAGITLQVGAVAIDGVTWLTDPVSGRWAELPPEVSFDPTALFDPELGWRPLFTRDLADAEIVGIEELEGASVYHVRGTAAAERLEVVTSGLVADESVELDLWIAFDDLTVRRASFTSGPPGAETMWELTFAEFGSTFEIDAPNVG